jgi:hypothetical protein
MNVSLRPQRPRAAIVGVAAGLLLGVACEDPNVHVFSGQEFDSKGQCLAATPSALDIIGGNGATLTCSPTCLTQSSLVYVSTQCPPYPPQFAIETANSLGDASDPCAAALGAYEAGVTCGAGGDDGGDDGGDGGVADATVADATGSDAGGG